MGRKCGSSSSDHKIEFFFFLLGALQIEAGTIQHWGGGSSRGAAPLHAGCFSEWRDVQCLKCNHTSKSHPTRAHSAFPHYLVALKGALASESDPGWVPMPAGSSEEGQASTACLYQVAMPAPPFSERRHCNSLQISGMGGVLSLAPLKPSAWGI